MDSYRPEGGRVLLGPMLTEGQVARRLGVAASYVRTRPYLLRIGGSLSVGPVYPSWILDGAGVDSAIGFVAWLLKRRMPDLEACDWLVRSNAELRGVSPTDWLRSGGSVDAVVARLPSSGTEPVTRPELDEVRRAWLSFRGDAVTPGWSVRWDELASRNTAYPLGV